MVMIYPNRGNGNDGGMIGGKYIYKEIEEYLMVIFQQIITCQKFDFFWCITPNVSQ
jgi:hypothetical protein